MTRRKPVIKVPIKPTKLTGLAAKLKNTQPDRRDNWVDLLRKKRPSAYRELANTKKAFQVGEYPHLSLRQICDTLIKELQLPVGFTTVSSYLQHEVD